MHSGSYAGIVCCSNPLSPKSRPKIDTLCTLLRQADIVPICSNVLYENDLSFSCDSPSIRGSALMSFYRDDRITDIFDISGGDLANTILPYLDFDCIAASKARFWGYSDLTVLLNAIYTKTHKSGVLYQIRHLLHPDNADYVSSLRDFIHEENNDFCSFPYHFVQGTQMDGITIGGNIRCLLKLAGTEYFPNCTDKILILEARSGGIPQISAFLAQLHQLGVFRRLSGILLGTFTQLEQEGHNILPLLLPYAKQLPIAVTSKIGHGTDAKAVLIGTELHLKA